MTSREDLRFNTSLPARLNEFAILINARFWGSRYEWSAHKPHEELGYDFCTSVHRQHFVDEALFKRAVATLGEQGVSDLVGVNGTTRLVRWS